MLRNFLMLFACAALVAAALAGAQTSPIPAADYKVAKSWRIGGSNGWDTLALEASGEDYNAYVPIMNALNALGKHEVNKNILQRCSAALENHLAQVPEDARARILLGSNYAELGRIDDAMRETNLAITLRPDEASIIYNAACMYCFLKKKPEALSMLKKAWEAGFKDAGWARKDPDLVLLVGEPEFERMYPAKPGDSDA